MIVATRPKQWPKNALVLAVPFAAGEFTDWSIMKIAILAMLVFTVLSAGVYVANDIRDIDEDRVHPRKSRRPFAAGELSRTTGVVMCSVLILAALTAAYFIAMDFLVLCVAYLAIQAAYVIYLRSVALLDITVIASGFLLRALAGGLATDLPVSDWFLLVIASSSLFVAAGKRFADLMHHSTIQDGTPSRASLHDYTETYLRALITIVAALAIVFYALWAIVGTAHGNAWATASILPFALGILEYLRRVDRGETGTPEAALLHDRGLQLVGLAWLVCLAISVTAN
jgi:decaprenyl-phosphate phosphoribosyltransferase